MAAYFEMDVKATRLNWYRDSTEWKPFHHDAAAMKEKFARTQNFTLGVSFGAERDAAFEHAQVGLYNLYVFKYLHNKMRVKVDYNVLYKPQELNKKNQEPKLFLSHNFILGI